jgi:hypothetical protein
MSHLIELELDYIRQSLVGNNSNGNGAGKIHIRPKYSMKRKKEAHGESSKAVVAKANLAFLNTKAACRHQSCS